MVLLYLTVGSQGGLVSYERGIPVVLGARGLVLGVGIGFGVWRTAPPAKGGCSLLLSQPR